VLSPDPASFSETSASPGTLSGMGWLRRLRGPAHLRPGGPAAGRGAAAADEQHLREWVAVRYGVEGFVEPRTAISDVTLLLVAGDGEWTRRRVPSADWAHRFANQLGVPSYDAAVVGYPERMREYNRRKKQSGL
jgi:hypothetical protein